jgi:hypothetical protein
MDSFPARRKEFRTLSSVNHKPVLMGIEVDLAALDHNVVGRYSFQSKMPIVDNYFYFRCLYTPTRKHFQMLDLDTQMQVQNLEAEEGIWMDRSRHPEV